MRKLTTLINEKITGSKEVKDALSISGSVYKKNSTFAYEQSRNRGRK